MNPITTNTAEQMVLDILIRTLDETNEANKSMGHSLHEARMKLDQLQKILNERQDSITDLNKEVLRLKNENESLRNQPLGCSYCGY